jgi:hypothetical protein
MTIATQNTTMKARGYALDDLSLDGVNFIQAVWQTSLIPVNTLSDRFMDLYSIWTYTPRPRPPRSRPKS